MTRATAPFRFGPLRAAGLSLLLLGAIPGPRASADEQDPHLADAETALVNWDLEVAQLAIDQAPAGAARDGKQGVLHVFAGRYAEAEALLAAALASGDLAEGSPKTRKPATTWRWPEARNAPSKAA